MATTMGVCHMEEPGSAISRRLALADIHGDAGLSQNDIERLREVYISGCFCKLNKRTPPGLLSSLSFDCQTGVSHDDNIKTVRSGYSRQRSVPVALNELSIDSRLIQFLESKGVKPSSTAVIHLPLPESPSKDEDQNKADADNQNTKDSNGYSFIEMLTRERENESFKLDLVQNITSTKDNVRSHTDDSNTNRSQSIRSATPLTQKRLDRMDVLASPRFKCRRNALANILENIKVEEITELKRQRIMPFDLNKNVATEELVFTQPMTQPTTQLKT